MREGQGGGRGRLTRKRDITDWIKQEGHRRDFWFTTMFDLYGLASVRDFPGYAEASRLTDPEAKVAGLEAALAEDIGFDRFIPHIQLHEFESLLLVDPAALKGMFIEQTREIDALAREIAETRRPPELINEGRETKPSRRIGKYLPAYEGNKGRRRPRCSWEYWSGPSCRCLSAFRRVGSAPRNAGQWIALAHGPQLT